MITFNEKTQSAKAWAEEMGITYVSLRSRLSLGWSIERALTTPTRHRTIVRAGSLSKGGDYTVLEATCERKRSAIVYRCRCNHCGSEVLLPSNKLTDTMAEDPLYRIWVGMIRRCENVQDPAYKHYGDRGIMVCERWHGSFINFAIDMGDRPSAVHSIDRIDNDGDYEPCNCRWATNKQQARNRSNNIMFEYLGKTQCLSAWAEWSGIPYKNLHARYRYGWSTKKMLTTPVRSHKKVTRTIQT